MCGSYIERLRHMASIASCSTSSASSRCAHRRRAIAWAVTTGEWRLRQIYDVAYSPIAGTFWLLGALGLLPRVGRSTKNEGHERRYFYGSVWAVCVAQPVLGILWTVLPRSRTLDAVKLAIFVGILVWMGNLARRGLLPRTRPIVPGELAISD